MFSSIFADEFVGKFFFHCLVSMDSDYDERGYQ
jgi:hypothetical protein